MDDLQHTVYQLIDRAVECGLHAVAITWHRKQFDILEAIEYARERGLLLIPGIETEINGRCHTIVLNAPLGTVGSSTTMEELARIKENPLVFTIAPHPYYPFPSCLGRLLEKNSDLYDAVEWCHLNVPFLPWFMNPNAMARAWAVKHNKPVLACSDTHCLDSVGCNASEVDADELTAESIFAAIRARRVTFVEKMLSVRLLVRAVVGIIRDSPFSKRWGQSAPGEPLALPAATDRHPEGSLQTQPMRSH